MTNRKWIISWALLLSVGMAHAQLKGAGSSFAASLYDTWANSSGKAMQVKLDYVASGSSAGVKAAQDRSVDFGASDKPMTRAELDASGLVQFPTAIGGIVVVTNLPGIPGDKLRLDGATLADMYLGKIKVWNDAAIKALNPALTLPSWQLFPSSGIQGPEPRLCSLGISPRQAPVSKQP